tara:strand:+ start:205 stop:597 length:393 start_codon:yes stop_codon:yes gene_type:complete
MGQIVMMRAKQHQLFLSQLDSAVKFWLGKNAALTRDCMKPKKHYKCAKQNKATNISEWLSDHPIHLRSVALGIEIFITGIESEPIRPVKQKANRRIPYIMGNSIRADMGRAPNCKRPDRIFRIAANARSL